MKKSIIIPMTIAIIFASLGAFIGYLLKPEEKCVNVEINNEDTKDDEPTPNNENKKDLIGHTFTRTYYINHIAPSNDFDYVYITIREFQAEEIETVKVRREMFESANVNENWEVTFKITNNDIEDNLKSIFNNTEVIKAEKTEKTGLEQVSDSIE